MATSAKPVRLELNNSGAWKVLGRFDAADDDQTDLVLHHAEELVKTLHNSEDAKRCPTLRVSMDHPADSVDVVLLRWDLARGWRDAATGLPA
jgi:hypothetical protein